MAQWYTQLVFKGDTFLGDGLADFELVEGVVSPDAPLELRTSASAELSLNTSTELKLNGGERYTTVLVSGYALYGQLRGYYALGVAHIWVDPVGGQARYLSEQSACHQEPVDSLTPAQRAAVREYLARFNPEAWETSNISFRQQLEAGQKEL
jgi:hypothetical protein